MSNFVVKSGSFHGIGTANPTKTLEVGGDALVDGNLIVTGTTTTADSETILIQDNHLYLNAGYTADAAQTGGIVVNVDPDPTATEAVAAGGFVAGVASTSNPTIEVAATTGFATNDFIQVSGSTSNDGLYEVLSLLTTPNRIEVRGIGVTATVEDFTQNQFVTEAGVGQVDKVKVAVIRAGTDGIWEQATGDATTLSFTDLGGGGGGLSNPIGESLTWDTDSAYDIGTTSVRSANIYSDRVWVQDGAAGDPGLRFDDTGGSQNGIYFDRASGEIRFSTQTNNRLRISSGQVIVGGQLRPSTAGIDLGNSTEYWGALYATRWTANTAGSATTPTINFWVDTNTGIYSPSVTDDIAISTGGVQRQEWNNTEVVINDTGASVDFRVEGSGAGTNPNLFFVDASENRVGVNNNAPGATLDVDNGAAAESIFIAQDNGSAVFTVGDAGDITAAPAARTTGSPTLLTVTGPAHTTLTASTEAIDVDLDLARTVQFATGALATQRAMRIQAPTYAFAGASTITNAYTMSVEGAPVAGTNATITNRKALYVEGGAVFEPSGSADADVIFNGSTVNDLLVVESGLNRVGVGTNVPGATLEAKGGNATEAVFIARDNAGNTILDVGGTGGGGDLLQVWTTTTATMKVLSAGGAEISNVVSANDILALQDGGTTVVRFPDAMESPLAGMQLHGHGTDGELDWGTPDDPTRRVSFYDDFMFDTVNNWTETVSGADAGVGSSAFSGHPGVVALDKGTTATGRACIHSQPAYLMNFDVIVFECAVRLSDLSDATNEYDFTIGIGDTQGAGDQNDGIYFKYDRNTSVNWQGICANAGTRTSGNTSQAVAAGTWVRLKFVYDLAGGDVEFFVNGSSVLTVSTNLPLTTVSDLRYLAKIEASAGTAFRLAYVDYYAFTGHFAAAR